MTANNTYIAYQLRISSPIRLPGLQQTNGNPDVTIEYGRLDSGVETGPVSDEMRLSYDGIGVFEIRNGRHVVIDPGKEISDTTLQPYLLGPIMGVILYQRGYLVLHASAVSMNDTAVAFLGPSGAGKSTIVAACQVNGHDILSDDITAVEIVEGEPMVIPGMPLLKLTPEFVDSVDLEYECLSAGLENKVLYRTPRDVPQSPYPLKQLYVITDGGLQSTKLSPGGTIQALVGNTYTQSLLDKTSIGNHFRQCTCVADATEVRHLSRPRDIGLLSETVKQIEQEVSQ